MCVCDADVCYSNQAGDQDVQLMNDRKIVAQYSDPRMAHAGKPVDQGKCNIYMVHFAANEFNFSCANLFINQNSLNSKLWCTLIIA